jgi:hypothetical protein
MGLLAAGLDKLAKDRLAVADDTDVDLARGGASIQIISRHGGCIPAIQAITADHQFLKSIPIIPRAALVLEDQ